MRLFHLSDIHLRSGWFEESGVVLTEFLKEIGQIATDEDYLVISGDLVQSGADISQYSDFETNFLTKFAAIGLDQSRTIMVPGNHDVDRVYVEANLDVLRGLSEVLRSEGDVNRFLNSSRSNVIDGRFSNYTVFEACNARYGCGPRQYGVGHVLPGGVGIYCLNTALFSFGGLKGADSDNDLDYKRLVAETREINKWVQENQLSFRILIMHHPFDWLADWAGTELSSIVKSNFDLCLHGHIHKQSVKAELGAVGDCIVLSAPPLFTRKHEKLGYAIITVDDTSVAASYRQWSPDHRRFVTGVDYSGTDNGQVVKARKAPIENKIPPAVPFARTTKYLEQALKNSLTGHMSSQTIWIVPELSRISEHSDDARNAELERADLLAKRREHLLIKAPPQFGLSSTGIYIGLCKANSGIAVAPIVYRCADAPNHEQGILEYIRALVLKACGEAIDPDCIIVDEFDPGNDNNRRQLRSLHKSFPVAQLVVLVRVDEAKNIDKPYSGGLGLEMIEYSIWQLSRHQMRSFVAAYIATSNSVLTEEPALNRLAENLTGLNLPRTAHNCLTLLTIFESQADAAPVNRTEVMQLFLQVLFAAVHGLPRYNAIPDLKDSLYAIGYLCEKLVRENKYFFSKTAFFSSTNEYCSSQLIDIEIDTLFLMLCECNILVRREDGNFEFRYSYWLYFFAANRMHHDRSFYDFVLESRRYANFPGIIEFYSGIDRRSTDLLTLLLDDIKGLNKSFVERTGFSDDFEPFGVLTWEPDLAILARAKVVIETESSASKLPTEVKDAIADGSYDRSKPYKQSISTFLDDASMFVCMQVMRASAIALRNSDHADVQVRKLLLEQIMLSWAREVRVLATISPLLAEVGAGGVDGLNFYLDHSFDGYEGDDKLREVMVVIPWNVGNYYQSDFFSQKMGPLYADFMSRCADDVTKHILICQLIRGRSKGWELVVGRYVNDLNKNSFYLADVSKELKREYDMVSDSSDGGKLRSLVGLAYGKHFAKKRLDQKVRDAVASIVLRDKSKE